MLRTYQGPVVNLNVFVQQGDGYQVSPELLAAYSPPVTHKFAVPRFTSASNRLAMSGSPTLQRSWIIIVSKKNGNRKSKILITIQIERPCDTLQNKAGRVRMSHHNRCTESDVSQQICCHHEMRHNLMMMVAST